MNRSFSNTTAPAQIYTLSLHDALPILDPGQRLIVVSGPNAGGKSVLLKAVALNQLMLQCGYLIPVSDESVAGMFRRFFADIGDQQSLEEDLSTYSSHLRNMREFLRHADHHSMVFMRSEER